MNSAPTSTDSCPFCLSNNTLQGEILADSQNAYLTRSAFSPNNYLIIPKDHIESIIELSDTWWNDMKRLIAHIPDLSEHYNISINYGQNAGQNIKHIHFWIIPRKSGEAASGKGLAKLISEANQ